MLEIIYWLLTATFLLFMIGMVVYITMEIWRAIKK